jgi:thymidylate synthase (FAD)
MLNEDENGNPLDERKSGLARELARMNLTLNTYTQWYWKIDLHNLLHFLSLRADSHAQYEIRVYAEAMLEILKRWVPTVYDAFMDYRVGGFHLSAGALDVVKQMLKGETVAREDTKLSPREWRELMDALDQA